MVLFCIFLMFCIAKPIGNTKQKFRSSSSKHFFAYLGGDLVKTTHNQHITSENGFLFCFSYVLYCETLLETPNKILETNKNDSEGSALASSTESTPKVTE